MKKVVIKKIIAVLLFVTVIVNVIFMDYRKAYAAGEAMVIELVTTLIGVVMSGMSSAGLAFTFPETESEDDEYNYTSEEYIDVINKANSGETLSNSESAIFLEAAELIEGFYKDVIDDMVSSGVFEESEETKALSYIYGIFGMDNVTRSDVQNALQRYVQYKAALDVNLPNFKIVGSTIAFAKDMINSIFNDISKAVSKYVKKTSNSLVKGKYLNFSYDLMGKTMFNEGSDIVSKINEVKASGKTYILVGSSDGKGIHISFAESPVASASYALACSGYFRTNNTNVVKLKDSSVIYREGNSSVYMYFYDDEGNFIYRGFYSSSSFDISNCCLYYYYGIGFGSSLLERLGLVSLPLSFEYGSVGESGRDTTIPIDDIYAGDDAARPTTVPIDNVDENKVIVNSGIKDIIINEALNGIAGTNAIDATDDRATVWEGTISDAIDNAIEEAEKDTPIEDIGSINTYFDMANYDSPGLSDRFPFCIPFDLIDLIGVFAADPVTPYIEIPFVFERLGIDEKIVIDFSEFETVAEICRWIERIGFIGFLVIKTRNLVKG